jgi:Ni2+-binding GTPase involved in maturation of urease and hydrogenase
MEFLIVLVIVTLGLQGSGKTLLLTGICRCRATAASTCVRPTSS